MALTYTLFSYHCKISTTWDIIFLRSAHSVSKLLKKMSYFEFSRQLVSPLWIFPKLLPQIKKNFGAKILIWKINVARFARNKWDFLSNFQTLWCMHFLISILKYSNHFSYRTFSMAHSDVAFNVKRRCSSESECLHMSINQCVVHVVCHAPCALESRNQFVVDGASMMVDQLDLFVGSIMGIAVVDQNVESVW